MLRRTIFAAVLTLLPCYAIAQGINNPGPCTAFGTSAGTCAQGNDSRFSTSSTWTPALTFGGGSTGITYARQVGTYTKSGLEVFACFDIVLTSKGSSTGTAKLSTPFATSNASFSIGFGSIPSTANMLALTAPLLLAPEGGASTTLINVQGATSATSISDASFTDSSNFQGCMVYRSAS